MGSDSAGARNAALAPGLIWGVSLGTPEGGAGSPPQVLRLSAVPATAREKLHARMSWVLIAANWS